jgi:hypothetical protein
MFRFLGAAAKPTITLDARQLYHAANYHHLRPDAQ